MAYYREEIEKNTQYRTEYSNSIEFYLSEKKKEAEEKRSSFIDPRKYANDPEFARERLMDMLGFPLGDKREAALVEKCFVVKDGNVNIIKNQELRRRTL